ncbi:autotransporter domain-containing protein, partial [Pseudovibrio sp. W64]|uniref:autotransporter domain-containing protein n=1 Tax=Pseudovibrio sp. W64 TaxID=1735583 RepID=UPI00187CC4E0
IGRYKDSTGIVEVTGTASTWDNSENLYVGGEGDGTLTISNDATVSVSGVTRLGSNSTGSGVLNIGAGSGDAAATAGTLDTSTIEFGDGTGVINFNHTESDYTFSADISGNGSVNQLSGTTILTGTNTYTGETIVSGGTLELRGGSVLTDTAALRVGYAGTGALTIAEGSEVNSGYLNIGRVSGSVTVTGSGSSLNVATNSIIGLYGTGTLTISDGGRATSGRASVIGGPNATGAVTVTDDGSIWEAGSLWVGQYGAGSLKIENGGKVTSGLANIGFDSTSFSGTSSGIVTVTGEGSVWESRDRIIIGDSAPGTLTIADGATVDVDGEVKLAYDAVSQGTLNIGAAAGETAVKAGTLDTEAVIFGEGTGVINFNHTDTAYVFAPKIIGDGGVNQLSGTTTLTGANTYTGGTTVSGGKLVVDGTIGDVTVNGGSLGGSGTVGAVAFHSGAVIAPGNSIGTLNATSLVFNSGSTFEVELNDRGNAAGINNDLLAASGTVMINGGTVYVKPENGTDDGSTYVANTVYTIMSAVGGVSGTFDSSTPTDDFAFLDFALSYDANNVYLGSQMASSTFCISGMSANQCATGEGAFSLGSGDLFNSVLNLSNSDAPGALDQLSGEADASIKTALIEDSRFAREAALSRVRVAMDSVAADGQKQVEKRVGESLAFWGQGFGSWGRWNGNSNAAGLDRSIGGFLLGGDTQIGESSRFGFFGGYDNSSFEVNGRTSSATADTLHLGAYGGTEFGPLGVRAGGSYAWHDIDTTRSVAFSGFTENLSGSYTARTAQIFGEAGYRFDYAATSLEPFANISYIQLSSDGYSETSGFAALKAGRQTMDSTFASIGLRAETRANLGQLTAKLSAQAAWQHAFGDVTPVVNHAFAGGDDFSVVGIPIAKDALFLNLGASVDLGRNTTLGLAYDGRFGSGFTDQGLKANIALKF